MNERVRVEVTTQVFGLGGGRPAPVTLVDLNERVISARILIAEHVRTEIERIRQRRTNSLALHYMLADDVRADPNTARVLDADTEIRQACRGFIDQRYMLMVDGVAIDRLDATLRLSERSTICFVRLLPLIGG